MSGVEWTVLDNSNIVESYPGITLPLTYSFIRLAYRGVFRGVVGANLKNDTILAKFDDVFDNMIKSYKGRVYYSINNWYSLIDFMPFSKKVIPIWQDMMGVKNSEVYLGKRHDFTVWQKLKLYGNIAKTALHVTRSMERLNQDFLTVQAYFEEEYRSSLSVSELFDLFHEIERRVLDKWYITIANDMYTFLWTGLVKRGLRKKGVDVAQHIAGIASLESLKPIKALLAIAQEHGNDADLMDSAEVQEYIRIYGDRCPCELKLETMTYREDPSLLEQRIREYASDKIKLDAMIKNLKDRETAPIRNTFALKRMRIGIQNREISRLNRSRIYGMVRRIFITVGQQLHRDGYIDEPLDVFYLEIREIQKVDTVAFRGLVASRKAEYAEYEQLPAHTRLVFRGDTLVDENVPTKWSGGYSGVGVSEGHVTAEAVVLESPDEKAEVKGKIVVTKTTDPGWVFLLAMASGIVAEKGSLLSHTAIVARELKIPAVVAVESATSVIKTGDIVSLDGDTGRVEIVRAS